MEIIPAILESTWPEVERKIKLIDGLADWIQLDVSDGRFTPYTTWSNPQDLFLLEIKSRLEIHLMIEEPWLVLESWLAGPVSRIVVHVEAVDTHARFDEILSLAQKYGKEIVWGFKIETPWSGTKGNPLSNKGLPFVRVLFLSVQPGRQGQEFDRRVLDKISSLLKLLKDRSSVTIEVDGGINPDVISDLKNVGADAVVVGSYIFGRTHLQEAVKELQCSGG